MSDTQLLQPPDTRHAVRQAQVARVIAMMAETGISQAEACAIVGIKQRTFQRWMGKPEMQVALRQFAQEAITNAAVIATGNLPAVVQRQVKIATEGGQDRDATTAAKFLKELVIELAGLSKPAAPGQSAIRSAGDDEEGSIVQVTFNPRFHGQKATIEVTQPQVIDGQSSALGEGGS